jgi:HD-GYP domain-containing protein (c-di-GMP phosphodiesterase class II)
MLFSIICFILILAGLLLMAAAIAGYHKLLEFYRQGTYQSLRPGYKINLGLLYFFLCAYILALADVFLRPIDLSQIIVALIFFLGALYVFFSVKTQAVAAHIFREKSLEVMRTFVNTIDLKDFSTEGHSRQVYEIVNLFYDHLDEYKPILNKMKLLDAAMLHDIGKINIPADIFSKQDRLSPEEWKIIKSHPLKGKEMLDETIFSEISDWVKYHHERMDGNGYYGMSADTIPLESKIITLADAYSALCSDRAYRKRLSHEDAMEIIRRDAGKHFDRKLAERFVRLDKEALEKR